MKTIILLGTESQITQFTNQLILDSDEFYINNEQIKLKFLHPLSKSAAQHLATADSVICFENKNSINLLLLTPNYVLADLYFPSDNASEFLKNIVTELQNKTEKKVEPSMQTAKSPSCFDKIFTLFCTSKQPKEEYYHLSNKFR